MGLNAELPRGFVVKLSKNTSEEWDWSVMRFGRPLASGHEKTEKAAAAALKKSAGEMVVDAAGSRATRSIAKLKLRSWVERRPFVAIHVFSRALDGVGLAEIIKTAEAEERELWRLERERCGEEMVPPLSEHPARKPALEVADDICKQIRALGWRKPQVKAYALKMFGEQFFNTSFTVDDVIALATKDERGGKE